MGDLKGGQGPASESPSISSPEPVSPSPTEPTPSVAKEVQPPKPVSPEPLASTPTPTPANAKEPELKVVDTEVKKDQSAPTSEIEKEKVEIKKPEPSKPVSPLPTKLETPKPEEEQKREQEKKLKEEEQKKNKKTIIIKLPPLRYDSDEGNKQINKKLSLNYPTKEELKKMVKALEKKLGDKFTIALTEEKGKDSYSISCKSKTSGQSGSLTYDKGTGKLHIEGDALSAAGDALKHSWNLMTKGQFEDSTQSLKEVSAIVTQGDTVDVVKELGLQSVKLQEEKPSLAATITKEVELKAESEAKISMTPSPGGR